MHHHTGGEIPPEPVLEDDEAGKDKLHALEQRIKELTRSANLSKTHRAKLRKAVEFLPEGGTEMVTGPSPIELWDTMPEYPAQVEKTAGWLAGENGGNVLRGQLVNKLCSANEYKYIFKTYGIPGVGGKAAKPVTELDGIPFDAQETAIMQMVGRGDKTLDEAACFSCQMLPAVTPHESLEPVLSR